MNKSLLFLLMVVFTFSCKKKDETEDTTPTATEDYTHGVFVVNEGSYGANNGSLSYISTAGEIVNDIYFAKNNAELGDVFQSFYVIGEKGYAVLNNSQKIEVIDMKTMKHLHTITDLDYPRYMLYVGNDKAYITNGSTNGTVKILDTTTDEIIGEIAVGNGPEKMLLSNGHVFVCNSGGFLTDNTVSVIDVNSNVVLTTITVGDRPQDIVQDAYGNAWVMCSGETLYDDMWNVIGNTDATLCRVNLNGLVLNGQQTIGVNGDHPRNLEVSPDQDKLYYENNGVYYFSISTGDLPGIEIVQEARGSLDIDPATGDVWCSSVSDFSAPSQVYRYNPAGVLQKTYTAGIGTNAVGFN